MELITLEQARMHVKADGDDDDVLILYGNGAEAECARLANRSLFPTADSLQTAISGVPNTMAAAYQAYDAAVSNANAQDDDRIKTMMLAQAQLALDRTTIRCDGIIHGVSVDDPQYNDIIVAVLLTVGHNYRNRENVATGQGAAAIEIPMTAGHIMAAHRWIGDL